MFGIWDVYHGVGCFEYRVALIGWTRLAGRVRGCQNHSDRPTMLRTLACVGGLGQRLMRAGEWMLDTYNFACLALLL